PGSGGRVEPRTKAAPLLTEYVAVCALPARQDAFPVRVHVLAHLRLIVALAQRYLVVALAPARHLIVIETHPQTGFIRNENRAVHKRDAPALNDFVLFDLPGIMCITGIGQIRGSR